MTQSRVDELSCRFRVTLFEHMELGPAFLWRQFPDPAAEIFITNEACNAVIFEHALEEAHKHAIGSDVYPYHRRSRANACPGSAGVLITTNRRDLQAPIR